MNKNNSISFVEAVRRIYPRLTAHKRAEIEPLLKRAEQGDLLAELDIADALKDYPDIGAWIQGMTRAGTKGYSPPTGTPPPPPVSQHWRCPDFDECGEWEPVIQTGEDAPECPVHSVPMVLKK